MNPLYRKKATKYNFDDYSSKGSAVHPVKKMHRQKQLMDGYIGGAAQPAITDGQQGNSYSFIRK